MANGATTLKSNGEPSARGYAVAVVRPRSPEPHVGLERVVIVRPTQTATRTGPCAGAGPRDPLQSAWPPAKARPVELLDGRPATKAQRFWIDPEQLARWEAEAEAKRRQSA